jgi:hypothetical protein
MTVHKSRAEPFLSELGYIELQNQRLLDDDSLKLLAEVRSQNLLTEREWIQIKQFLKDALQFLSGPQSTMTHTPQGSTVIDPDADPRNANWLRIDAACRLGHRALPMWAAMWLWQLRTDTSPAFWRRVGRIAEQLGHPKLTSEEPRTG